MQQSEINFIANRKKKYNFTVINNLDEFGIDIYASVINWTARTNDEDLTIMSFCEYVMSKDINIICKPLTANKKER